MECAMESDTDQSDEDGYFGQQQVPLTDEIKEILEEYPDGQIFKEILQNADDAGATEVKFFIDERSHGQHDLLHPSLAKFQGPSLLAYNDAVFTDEDWSNIQKLKRSDKRSDPFKVGKFGIGFNSVFHVTDLPTIISGKWMGFMDPQKKIWKGLPGHKYKLKLARGDSCEPFIFDHHCSLESNKPYPGTMIRLPLRNNESEISSKLYTISKLKSLLSALKNDAESLLLFLRYVESIKVYTIDLRGKTSKIFSVEADIVNEKQRRKSKNRFFEQVREYHANCISSISFPHLQYEVTITMQDLVKRKDCQWLVMNWVGSANSKVQEMSNRMLNLPWLGLAVPFASESSSRLFCFLPLPDSEEVNPPLPVCVHGTFGLTKDRRHLKWKTSDMQNDGGALWNELLLSKMLPSCYAHCLNSLKSKYIYNPDAFYSFWPDVNMVNKTNWKIILKPLLSVLLHDQLFWSRNGNWVKFQPSVLVVPEVRNRNLSEVVITTLIECGKVVVELPIRVWEAIKWICSNNVYPFTIITPSLLRQVLRDHSLSMNQEKKLELLQYCLDDNDFNDLIGLKLLPVTNTSFQTFKDSSSKHKIYFYNLDFLEPQLLAAYKSKLVNLENKNKALHDKLQLVAKKKCTQLKMLTLEAIAVLLKDDEIFKNGYCSTDSEEFFDDKWLKLFWKWVKNYSLSPFISIPLLPISNGISQSRYKVVSLVPKDQSQVIKCSKNEVNDYELITAAEKLGCYFSFTNDFRYLYHHELDDYIHNMSMSSVLKISLRLSVKRVKFTSDEAKALRHFLFHHCVNLTKEQSCMVSTLHIFPAVQNNALYSLTSAKTTLAGKTTAILIAESNFPSNYKCFMPETPVILTCSELTIANIQTMLPGFSCVFTKAKLILDVMLPAIEQQQLTRDDIIKYMSIILEPKEYHTLASSSEGDKLVNKLKSLKFLPTNTKGTLRSPSKVYDPNDDIVRELFKGQDVYPIEPFVQKHFVVLRELGMKTNDILSPADIVKVADIISKHFESSVEAETRRANKLLKFLSSPKGSTLLNTHYHEAPLENTLCSMQWLPVIITPPENYPKCLDWKGASGSQFVSPQYLHASGSPEDHKKLPYLIGSQVKLLQYDGILPIKLIASLGIPQSVPLDAVIQQFVDLVRSWKEKYMKRSKFNYCVELLYENLQSAVIGDRYNENWKILRQSEVVQVREDKFVKPSVVACSFDDETCTVGKLEPYLYTLPYDLLRYKSFFGHIGVKKEIITEDIFLVLKMIASKPNNNAWKIVLNILRWLCGKFTELQQLHDRIFVPVKSEDESKLVLKPANQVAFLNEDLQWLQNSKEVLANITADYFLVHSSINYNMACTLQLKPLNTMIANTEEFCFEQHGQSEPLTTRLNRILREYKDTSVIQELLQNADDAGATEVAVYYDTREHDSTDLFFPGMANSYGPALLFYNNAEFSEEDFENITKISGETKMDKPLKIGKFGVGFCSVYHITDVPSFVSGENFIIFDPTLQCLQKEIKSESNPGIKMKFHLFNKSNQLIPYMGLCEFNPKKRFKGTLFRFPLRSKRSKISKNACTEEKVQQMLNKAKENSSKLLMFLNNVKKITFWQFSGNCLLKDFEAIATKHTVPNNSNITNYKVSLSQSTNYKKEHWLIATNSQRLQESNYTQNNGIASVSIKLNTSKQSNKFCIEPIAGECFCYLPLHIETGLPVHVSSNFAVMTNRRGIWKANDSSNDTDSNWNKLLMESVVFQAYIELLLHLKCMQQNGSLVNYTFDCLWPVRPKEVNPWYLLVEKFYNTVLSSTQAVFYSGITNSWEKLDKCLFLSRKIFSTVNNFQNRLYSSMHRILSIFKCQLVDLTDEIWEKLFNHGNFEERIINEQDFITFFYKDEVLEKVSYSDKSLIVAASLIVYANANCDDSLPTLMKDTKCIPCCPAGRVCKRPVDIIDPKSQISKLFAPSDHMWPDDNFLKQSGLLHQSLLDLGMMTSLPLDLVIDRAEQMKRKFEEDRVKSFKYLAILLECINKIDSTESKLKTISFLPVMKKPENYPLTWKGDSNKLLCGPQLTKPTRKYDAKSANAIYACGSQVAILDTDAVPYRLLTDKVIRLLGITKDLRESDVVNHFCMLIKSFNKTSAIESNKKFLPAVKSIVNEVHKYWVSRIECEQTLTQSVTCLKDKTCIWNDALNKFLHPSCVSFNWEIDGPFLYKFPVTIPSSLKPLMKHLGVKYDFPVEVMLNVLCEMKHQYKDNVLPRDCQYIVQLILSKLRKISSVNPEKKIFLPDEDFILRDVESLRYNDAPWCTPDKKILYCHGSIERDTAIRLGVIPFKNVMLEDLDITDEWVEDFGQEEKLTVRLNNILRDYPRDITFLKEMLQNADDAGATKLFVILDKRYHNDEKVPSEEWKQLQGPAILIWNNSTFSRDDLNGIQRIGLGSKRDDADKIGKYGIGFNVVYHFTDCPSFITDNKLCIFDPHYRYIAENKKTKPGKMYKNLNTLWDRFPDMKSPYLQHDLNNFPPEMKRRGSLFRLPLRLTDDMAKQSEINKSAIDLQKLEHDLKNWVSQVVEALLFLRNINDVKLFIIDNAVTYHRISRENPVKLYYHTSSTKGQEKVIATTGNAKLVMFPMSLAVNSPGVVNNEMNRKEWFVQLGEGNVEEPEFDWNKIKPARGTYPRHGIAAPINPNNFKGKSFCFLPLPGDTNLPVHVHGQFVLHSDRRGIWLNCSNDDSGNTNDDPRTKWNFQMSNAISAAYAYFLINCIEHKQVPSAMEILDKSLQNYYSLFPNPSICKILPWSYIAIEVYKILSKLNASILATLVKCGRGSSSNYPSNRKFVIKWYQLHQPGAIDESHFHLKRGNLSVISVLKLIGMNITDTPMNICEWFNSIDLPKLPVISKKSVMQYYINFSIQICNQHPIPCSILCTKFCTITNFVTFLKYFMTSENKLSEETEVLTDVCSVGLIITVDGMLHGLPDGKAIISSHYWHLFPNSKQCFVHKDLLNFYPSDSKHLMKSTRNVIDQLRHISSIISSNIPFRWKGETQVSYSAEHTEWIQNMLICLTNDPTFSRHCHKILEKFPLLPADNGRAYSIASHVLPMKNAAGDNDTKPNYDIDNTIKLMAKLKVPLLKHDLIHDDTLDKIKVQIPSILIPDNILKNLYLIETHALFTTYHTLNKNELILLFKILKLVPYSITNNQQYIRKLPIFGTIDNRLVSLAAASEVWIWNNTEACLTGMDQWVKCIPSDIIFLNPSAPWACLRREADNLKMSNINKHDVYCKFIFPNFHHLDSNAQTEHLKFIEEIVHPECKHILKLPNNSNTERAKRFVSALRSLKCIPDSRGELRTIECFYDHNEPLFKAFCDESCFLPCEFRSPKWHEFLKYYGLKTSPTGEEFISYCKQLPNFSTVSAIKTGSEILLNVLFDISDSGLKQYRNVHSDQCLKEVSQIPIAVVKTLSDLDFIKEQKMGELRVNSKTHSLTITKLHGSSLLTNHFLVWTILPLIQVPNDEMASSTKFCERLEHLGVVQFPSVEDVLSNLYNISTSVFANPSRLDECNTDSLASKSSSLPLIVVHILEYLQTKFKKDYDYEDVCNQLEPRLSNWKFLPVKLPIEKGEEYALVKPTQVLFVEEPSEVASYYPFLHPLIDEASGLYKFLSRFGVKRSFTFCHVQLVLQLAKDLCKDKEVDENIKRKVLKVTEELIKLLKQTENKSATACCLRPLYLLSQENVLTECSKLIVHDIISPHHLPLPPGYAYLKLLKDIGWQGTKELLHLLPNELQLKSLQSILTYDLIDSKPAEDVFPHVSIIKDILLSSEFKKSIEIFAACCNKGEIPTDVTDILTEFQSKLTVQFLEKVQVKPKVNVDDKIFPIDNTVSYSFFLHKSFNGKWILSLKNTSNQYPYDVFVKLSQRLCLALKLKSTKCFKVPDDSMIPEVAMFICRILQCNSISRIVHEIKTYLPFVDTVDLEMDSSDDSSPSLGDPIPERFHYILDQHLYNFFYPEEWVGYENEDGKKVYAQILCEVVHEESTLRQKSNPQRMMERTYKISIGINEENIEVSALDLFKFKHTQSDNSRSDITEMDVYDGQSSRSEKAEQFASKKAAKKRTTSKDFKKTIRESVKAAWRLPEEEQRRKAIKRLYLQHHPDKNPDNMNATAEFQYLQQVIERMEKGILEDEGDENGTTTHHSQTSGTNWNSWYSQWDHTASSHRNFRSRDRNRMPGAWNVPKSQPNINEAKRWIRQAKYDYSALCVLTNESKSNSEVSAAACFMCHEVAEKSLKAGMYAKWGMGEVNLKSHDLLILASALANECPGNITDDANILATFYLDTRFPNRYSYPTVPGERFSNTTAEQGFDAATRIYEAIKQLIHQEESI